MRSGLAKYLDIIKINLLTNLGCYRAPDTDFLCHLTYIRHSTRHNLKYNVCTNKNSVFVVIKCITGCNHPKINKLFRRPS